MVCAAVARQLAPLVGVILAPVAARVRQRAAPARPDAVRRARLAGDKDDVHGDDDKGDELRRKDGAQHAEQHHAEVRREGHALQDPREREGEEARGILQPGHARPALEGESHGVEGSAVGCAGGWRMDGEKAGWRCQGKGRSRGQSRAKTSGIGQSRSRRRRPVTSSSMVSRRRLWGARLARYGPAMQRCRRRRGVLRRCPQPQPGCWAAAAAPRTTHARQLALPEPRRDPAAVFLRLLAPRADGPFK